LRLVFAGTPPFAARALEALAAAGHEVSLVLTQPDRPAGRGLKLTPPAVAVTAERLGLPLFKPTTLRDAAAVERLRAERAEAMIVAAYGLLLPQAVLDLPERGCINIHASLLPRWRGAAPIQRAILAGDAETGISLMQMDVGLDTGPVLSMERTPIGADETAGALTERLAALGARCLVEALAALPELVPRPQEDAGATYAAKVSSAEAALDWRLPAADLARRVRAFNPVPGASTRLRGDVVKVWEARVVPGAGAAGTLIADRDGQLTVACGDQALRLDIVQRAGGRRMAGSEFVRGGALAPGVSFDLPAPVSPS
jgi:methionyl-tRNA formyltransferase